MITLPLCFLSAWALSKFIALPLSFHWWQKRNIEQQHKGVFTQVFWHVTSQVLLYLYGVISLYSFVDSDIPQVWSRLYVSLFIWPVQWPIFDTPQWYIALFLVIVTYIVFTHIIQQRIHQLWMKQACELSDVLLWNSEILDIALSQEESKPYADRINQTRKLRLNYSRLRGERMDEAIYQKYDDRLQESLDKLSVQLVIRQIDLVEALIKDQVKGFDTRSQVLARRQVNSLWKLGLFPKYTQGSLVGLALLMTGLLLLT